MSKQPSELLPNYPYKSLRISLHYYMLNVSPFFPPEWFTGALIKLFGYLCYVLSHCGNFCSTALLIQFTFNTLLSLYRSFTMEKIL